jgi:hypothetical protein
MTFQLERADRAACRFDYRKESHGHLPLEHAERVTTDPWPKPQAEIVTDLDILRRLRDQFSS